MPSSDNPRYDAIRRSALSTMLSQHTLQTMTNRRDSDTVPYCIVSRGKPGRAVIGPLFRGAGEKKSAGKDRVWLDKRILSPGLTHPRSFLSFFLSFLPPLLSLLLPSFVILILDYLSWLLSRMVPRTGLLPTPLLSRPVSPRC